jgi:hypothetical protein
MTDALARRALSVFLVLDPLRRAERRCAMKALKHRFRPLHAVSAVLISVGLLAVSAPTLVPDASACQNSGYCGG